MVKIPNFFKKFGALEIILLIVFVIYLIFNIQTPDILTGYINSPLGIVLILILALSLFFYINPVLGVLGLFVAFELIRRSNVITPIGKVNTIQYTPKQFEKDEEMIKMNSNSVSNVNPIINSNKTLEEEIVSQMAPLGVSEPAGYFSTSFRPVSENVHNATTM